MSAAAVVLRLLHVDRMCRVWLDELEGAWRWECRLCCPVWVGRSMSWDAAHGEADEHMRVWHTSDPLLGRGRRSGGLGRAA